jgi:ABC-2 type transport system permease protein
MSIGNQLYALIWKDLKLFFKDTRAMVLIFLQPFLFIVIMSYALSNMYGSGRAIQILAVNEDEGSQAAQVITGLSKLKGFSVETQWEGQALTKGKAEELVARGKRNLAIIFPKEFSRVIEQLPTERDRSTTQVLLMVDPATSSAVTDPVLGTLQGLVERTAFTAMMPAGIDYLFDRYQIGDGRGGKTERNDFKKRAEGSLSGGLLTGENQAVTIEKVVPAAMRVKKFPDAFQQNVPGYTIYGVFWIASLLAGSVLREKREGTFRRLMVAPVSRTVILAGKLLPYYSINILQIIVMMAASALLFRMSFGHSFAGLIVVSLALAACATGLGIAVAAFARTEAQAGTLTVLLILTLSALGGCFVPRFLMPPTLKTIGLLTPHAWALDAYQDLIVRGYGLAEVMPHVGVLVGFALLFFIVGVRRFRFE